MHVQQVCNYQTVKALTYNKVNYFQTIQTNNSNKCSCRSHNNNCLYNNMLVNSVLRKYSGGGIEGGYCYDNILMLLRILNRYGRT